MKKSGKKGYKGVIGVAAMSFLILISIFFWYNNCDKKEEEERFSLEINKLLEEIERKTKHIETLSFNLSTITSQLHDKIKENELFSSLPSLPSITHNVEDKEDKEEMDKEEGKKGEEGGHRASVLVPIAGKMGGMLKEVFCRYMSSYLSDQLGEGKYEIVFGEQQDELPFNRGYAINIASLFSSPSSDYYVIHDVDMLPFNNTKYHYNDGGEVENLTNYLCNYKKWRECERMLFANQFVQGALSISKQNFAKINGLSNSFWGWGGEGSFLFLPFDK